MKLAGAGVLVDTIEADCVASAAPTGVEVAAQIAGDVASNFHIEGDECFALFGFDVVEDQRLAQAMFVVGGQPVAVGPEGAMTVEIEQPFAQDLVIIFAVGE